MQQSGKEQGTFQNVPGSRASDGAMAVMPRHGSLLIPPPSCKLAPNVISKMVNAVIGVPISRITDTDTDTYMDTDKTRACWSAGPSFSRACVQSTRPARRTLFRLPLEEFPYVGQALIKGVLGFWVEMPVGDVNDVLGRFHGPPHVTQGIGMG
ncbi:MAG: hypothetical protein FRX49_02609 [Trebouxia sp. A1-2]|nr:MAG: hypothetical protein FRX49_02609 [Trebouxia sp. A1-2]